VVKVKEKKKKTIKVEALGNRVLLKRDNPEEITEGGIILSSGAQEEPIEAEIFGVGPDCLSLKKGDKVLVPPHAGTYVVLRGNGFVIMPEEEVMVRIHEED